MWFAVAVIIGLFAMFHPVSAKDTKGAMNSPSVTMPMGGRAAVLKQDMRKLWSDHVIYTREYVVAAVVGNPAADDIAKRLLQNQDDIGAAIVPYYGKAAGDQLASLLKQHIQIAVDLVSAAKAGDNAKADDADKRWHVNASDIANFLAKANPHWPAQSMVNMLNQHLALTKDEAVAELQKRYDDSIKDFDQIFPQALSMGDELANGIIQQFPDKFPGAHTETNRAGM